MHSTCSCKVDILIVLNPEPPDNIPIPEFINNQAYGRCPLDRSKNPFTCSKTGKSYDAREVAKREDYLARGLRKHLTPEELAGSEWNRVVTIFSYNCVSSVSALLPLFHQRNRLSRLIMSLPHMLFIASRVLLLLQALNTLLLISNTNYVNLDARPYLPVSPCYHEPWKQPLLPEYLKTVYSFCLYPM